MLHKKSIDRSPRNTYRVNGTGMKEKLFIKTHMRVTEDMAREVNALAELEHRPIQDQYRYLIALALQVLRNGGNGNADRSGRAVTPDAAQPILSAPPIAAKSRIVTHRRSA